MPRQVKNNTYAIVLKNLEIPGSSNDPNKCDKFYLRLGRRRGKIFFQSERILTPFFFPDLKSTPHCGNKTDLIFGIDDNGPLSFFAPDLLMSAKVNRSAGYRGVRGVLKSFPCGGIFTNDVNITSPNYPSPYTSDTTCIWELRSGSSRSQWTLRFNDFSLDDDCEHDFLELYEGSTFTLYKSKRFCGSTIPETLTIVGSRVRLRFQSDSHSSSRGFFISSQLKSLSCGGQARSTIYSPGYPAHSYSSNLECVWFVRTDPGFRIRIEFTGRFDIEQSSNCTNDYLLIEARIDDQWVSPKRFCGLINPPPLDINANEARVTFRSDSNSAHGDGFTLNVIKVCGEVITSGSGSIESPGYPEYQSSVSCSWTFKGNPEDVIRLNFVDFELEDMYNEGCSYDYLTIYLSENATDTTKMLGPYCGQSSPGTVETKGTLVVKFQTDRGITRRGFKFDYQIVTCGGTFNSTRGIISSPNTDGKYVSNANCAYLITVPKGFAVKLRFLHFSLYKTEPCLGYHYRNYMNLFYLESPVFPLDYLEIRDGNSIDSNIIDRLCGYSQPEIITSSGNSMFLRFHSDEENEASGFSAVYTATPSTEKGCGGVLNASSGSIETPQLGPDEVFDPNIDCIWHIIGASNKVVKLTFVSMNMVEGNGSRNGSTSECSSEYLEIRDGLLDWSTLLEVLCGTNSPETVFSTDYEMRLHYHSESYNPGNGFKLNYEIVDPLCGGNHVVFDGQKLVITSPNFPSAYPASARCKWSVRGYSPFIQLNMKFTDLDVDCERNDRLEISIREIDANPFRICGASKLPSLHIPETIDIIFSSSPEPGFHHGFSAEIEVYTCNQTYTDDSGVIVSQNYPSFSGFHSSYCKFNISVPVNRTITVYFDTFQFEFTESEGRKSTCPSDSVMEVRGGSAADVTTPESVSSDSAPSQISAAFAGEYCGNSVPNPIFSSTNFLSFQVKGSMFRFHLTYTSTDQGPGCGGNITAPSGIFTSPFYPTPYNRDTECIWIIKHYGYHTFTLEFPEFALSSSPDCSQNSLEIYEGEDVTDSPAGRYCGQVRIVGYLPLECIGMWETQHYGLSSRPHFLIWCEKIPESLSHYLPEHACTLQESGKFLDGQVEDDE